MDKSLKFIEKMEKAKQEIYQLLYEFQIKNAEDYKNKSGEELAEIYENIKIIQEEYEMSEDDVEVILEGILGHFEV
ncbi:hypothetical protein JFL47_11565 [Haemophilus haemoglobinophilus]|nr:hypothetical protein [Canicola haemoglobinophilus]MBN6711852.1 hypothetical protein [Canicola haemoglobinophilus]